MPAEVIRNTSRDNQDTKQVRRIVSRRTAMQWMAVGFAAAAEMAIGPQSAKAAPSGPSNTYIPQVRFNPPEALNTPEQVLAYEERLTQAVLKQYFPNLDSYGVDLAMPDFDDSRKTLDAMRFWLSNWSFKLSNSAFFGKSSGADANFRDSVTRVKIDLTRETDQNKIPYYTENEDGFLTLHLSIAHGHPEQMASLLPHLVSPERNVYAPNRTHFTFAGMASLFQKVANRQWITEDQERINKGLEINVVRAPVKTENGEVINLDPQEFIDHMQRLLDGKINAIQNADTFLPHYVGLEAEPEGGYPPEMQLIGQYNAGEHQTDDNDYYDAFVERLGEIWVKELLQYFNTTDQVMKFMQLVYHRDSFSPEELLNIDPQVMAAYNHAVEVGLIPEKEDFNQFLKDGYLYPNGNDGETATNGVAFARLNGEFSDTIYLDLFAALIDLESGHLDNRELWHYLLAPFVHLYIPVETAEGVNWYKVGRILHRDDSRDFSWMISIPPSVLIPGIGTYDLEGRQIIIEVLYGKVGQGAFSYNNFYFQLKGHFDTTQTSVASDEQVTAESAVDPLKSE